MLALGIIQTMQSVFQRRTVRGVGKMLRISRKSHDNSCPSSAGGSRESDPDQQSQGFIVSTQVKVQKCIVIHRCHVLIDLRLLVTFYQFVKQTRAVDNNNITHFGEGNLIGKPLEMCISFGFYWDISLKIQISSLIFLLHGK